MNANTEIERRSADAEGLVPERPWTILRYDRRRYPFAEILMRDVYKVPRLDRLHEYVQVSRRARAMSDKLTSQDNLIVRKMMQDLPDDASFYRAYHRFILQVLSPLVGRALSYSSHPKMRIHFPGTGSVSSFHHDIVVTGRIDQINLWMPFTDVDETATLWLESDYGRGDYAPVPVRYGEALIFDGGYIGHGSVRNESSITRVSLDLRFAYKGATSRADGVDLMNRILSRLDRRAQMSLNRSPSNRDHARHDGHAAPVSVSAPNEEDPPD